MARYEVRLCAMIEANTSDEAMVVCKTLAESLEVPEAHALSVRRIVDAAPEPETPFSATIGEAS